MFTHMSLHEREDAYNMKRGRKKAVQSSGYLCLHFMRSFFKTFHFYHMYDAAGAFLYN